MPPQGEIALHDLCTIDGTDYSNLLRGWSVESENGQIEASGMSVSGLDEYIDGSRASAINMTLKYTQALNAALWPIHRDREVVAVTLQPQGLVDDGREIWFGNLSLPSYPPEATRGELKVVSVRWTPGDEDGIAQYAAS